eukprot:1154028-Pelagomonas_calceolata.AAC.10
MGLAGGHAKLLTTASVKKDYEGQQRGDTKAGRGLTQGLLTLASGLTKRRGPSWVRSGTGNRAKQLSRKPVVLIADVPPSSEPAI